jgi:hypothetical protein
VTGPDQLNAGAPGQLSAGAAAGLQRLLQPRAVVRAGERCEFCAVPVADEHQHVADLEQRGVMCACRACYLLFTQVGAGKQRYRSIPDRYRYDPAPNITDAQWDELQIPVRMAFFFQNSALEKYVAFYPSPAGATESLLPLDTWAEVLAANPAFADTAPDVEALLVQRRPRGSDGGFECFGVPIDACYELVGLVKLKWKGFDGGQEAWAALDTFFDGLRERATVVGGGT